MKTEEKIMKKETVLSNTALGLYKSPLDGEWMVAVLSFNPETGEAKITDRVHSGGGKDFAVEKFKIEVIQRGLFE